MFSPCLAYTAAVLSAKSELAVRLASVWTVLCGTWSLAEASESPTKVKAAQERIAVSLTLKS